MQNRPSFVVALVGAVGSLLRETAAEIKFEVQGYGYAVHVLRLSSAFEHVRPEVRETAQQNAERDPHYKDGEKYAAIRLAMSIGNAARAAYPEVSEGSKNGCLADLAIEAIRAVRQQTSRPLCVVIDSLKTLGELKKLREVYRERLVVVGVHTPKSDRAARLIHQLQLSAGRSPAAEEGALRLMGIDERERGTAHGQDVQRLFAEAEVYVAASARDRLMKDQVARLVRLLFADSFETPTADESAMMAASSAALRSACMSRAVGAAITTRDGDLVATGFNEVPRFGGGPYSSEGAADGRDYVRGQDENFVQKHALIQQLLRVVSDGGMLRAGVSIDQAARTLAASPAVKDMLASNLTEFGRDVHAEMAALGSANKRGVPVKDCTLYTTTFPCHNCAKHILSAGIEEVVFIEAYPKSFAEAFHGDSLAIDVPAERKLLVRAFRGVAPRLYRSIFAWRTRRNESDGTAVFGEREAARPWFTLSIATPEEDILRAEGGAPEAKGGQG